MAFYTVSAGVTSMTITVVRTARKALNEQKPPPADFVYPGTGSCYPGKTEIPNTGPGKSSISQGPA
jgi:hypothetical protein